MSIEALNYAIRLGDAIEKVKDALRVNPDPAVKALLPTPTEALLAVHLANHVDGEWRWESDKKKLARRCLTTKRTVQEGLRKFENDWGIISLRRFKGPRGEDTEGFEFYVHEEVLTQLFDDPMGFFSQLTEPQSTPDEAGSEKSSDPAEGLWITGSENSSTPANTGEENSSTPAGSEIYARSACKNFRPLRARTSKNPQSNPHSSSSSSGEFRAEPEAEPTAVAVGEEEEPLPGAGTSMADMASSSVASGHDSEDVFTHTTHGQVKLPDVVRALSAISTSAVTAEQAQKVAARILDRASSEPKASPTGFVVSAIRKSPSRTKHDLAVASGHVSESPSAGQPRPRPARCPIPAHADLGHHQSNCPECRDLTGDGNFPEAITSEIFSQLSEAGKASIRRYQVPVYDEVSTTALRRSRRWAEHQRVA